MAEEYDPYAQHNECPDVGYMDPPAEPYRYISPIKRENIYAKNSKAVSYQGAAAGKEISSSATNATSTQGGKRNSPIHPQHKQQRTPAAMLAASPLGKGTSAVPVEDTKRRSSGGGCDVGTQTTLTMDAIQALEAMLVAQGGVSSSSAAVSRSNSSAGTAKQRVTAGASTKRPSEPVRSSSSKKIPTVAGGPSGGSGASSTSIPTAAIRAKSSNKVGRDETATAGTNSTAVVAAPRATRLSVAVMGSPVTKPSAGDSTSPQPSSVSVLANRNQQLLLDVTPTAARRMFSGSTGSGRTASSNKVPQTASPSTAATLLKRGKSSERPATIAVGGSQQQHGSVTAAASGIGGSAGAALQAALARNLLRKQAATAASSPKPSAPSSDMYASHSSSTTTTGRRHVAPEFTTAAEATPGNRATTLALPAALTSSSIAAAKVGGPGGRAPSSAATNVTGSSSTLNASASKYSRGPSASSNAGPSSTIVVAASSQRRVGAPTAGTAASPSTAAAAGGVSTSPGVTPAARRVSAVVGAAPAPTRTASSKAIVRKVSTTPNSTTHFDPTADNLSAEVKKAQGLNKEIAHQQASLEDRERARQWQAKADEKVIAAMAE